MQNILVSMVKKIIPVWLNVWAKYKVLVTGLSVLASIASFFGPYALMTLTCETERVYWLLASLLFLLLVSFLFLLFSPEFVVAISSDKNMRMMYGNIFDQDKNSNIVVPMDDTFATDASCKNIAASSVHGQFLTAFVQGEQDEKELRRIIHQKLKQGGCCLPLGPVPKMLPPQPLGTAIDIDWKDRHFILFAMTELDAQTHVTSRSRDEYLATLAKAVRYICKATNGRPTYMPVFGVGHTRLVSSVTDGVRNMVQAFRQCDAPVKGLHIVMHTRKTLMGIPHDL